MFCEHIGEPPEKLFLRCFTDANFCGDFGSTRSTSGRLLALADPKTFFPLAWICKEQTSTSRSTAEAEIVSLAASLFSEALPQINLCKILLGRPTSCTLEQDNQATVAIAQAGYSQKLRYASRTQKINIKSIKEVIDRDNDTTRHINTYLQVADIFTKPVTPEKCQNAMLITNMITGTNGKRVPHGLNRSCLTFPMHLLAQTRDSANDWESDRRSGMPKSHQQDLRLLKIS